jgi:DNA mismatch endonuclease, patch repair protein
MRTTKQAERSRVMARVRSRGNKSTELRLLAILKAKGLKGWRRNYPAFGKPDFAYQAEKLAVFVDGCFWHGCPKCFRAPKSNIPYWRRKIERNRKRDIKVKRILMKRAWKVLRLWECELNGAEKVALRIKKVLLVE